MSVQNLLKETVEQIENHGKTITDVQWVGSGNGEYAISWDVFTQIANFKYDSGYGGNEIDLDLVVVGSDWWLERHEYDGSEWWEFKTLPTKLNSAIPFKFEHDYRYRIASLESET